MAFFNRNFYCMDMYSRLCSVKSLPFQQFCKKNLLTYLIEQGGYRSKSIHYLRKMEEEQEKEEDFFGSIPVLAYLLEYQDELSTMQQENIVELASLFPGKNSKIILWSGASGKKAAENRLFEQSDQLITEYAKKEETESDVEKTQTDGQESEDEKTQEQSIVLFDNGSADITSDNQKIETSSTAVTDEISYDSEQDLKSNLQKIQKLTAGSSRSYLLKNFYITDSSTSIDSGIFQVKKLLSMDMTLKKKDEPQILIFHTHGASEAFADSRAGKQEDSIVGVGSVLAEILSEQYGYQVLHDKTEYDKINGQIDRNKAYNNALKGLEKTLKKYPSIDVIIDLHRDGVGNKVNRTAVVNGKKTAQVMFFNGLSRNSSGDIAYLQNDNLQGNLAFSLQLKIAAMKRFKDFTKPIYLKSYRYNMHLRKRYTLIELGNENNTVQEEKNAALPLAAVIDAVLQGTD